ncbi:FAD-dependent monooxygenase [Actinoallomurus rhizosphaericola]|uniref:FAD-dependent monooxygenase n=1 Tax=Actinoallomurus rhizosphaericola TaxID=2952536 RepID=UPI002092A2C3|nr:FAD-dependent monooxygenase [Actinoallomurus rhizosphaericola]MCO5995402.1 FAD-dependent monooxygenase [Actinoallomurus rhizosphaericola]
MARDVIVVGAGPVGLMMAGELRLGGVDVVVYEKLPSPPRESRGASFTRRTAECFDQRGLLGRLGETEPADSHFGGVPIDLGMFEENHFGARGISQFRTERMLEGWATELGVPILRGYEVTGFRETPDGVVVAFDGPDGPGEDTARYLVGCDGGRSTIRRLAGIDFPGPEPTRGFYTADVTGIETRRRRIGENLPGGSMVMAMDLENGVTRVVVHERGMAPRDRDSLSYTELADAWQRLTGESIHHGECRWISCFTDASRVASEYRRGRVFLAGDATHVQPPAMAQGLSVGVQDAVNLGWKLAAVINGWAHDGLLDTYHAERQPIGRQLARNARAAIELRLTGEEMDPIRSVMGELVAYKDAAGHLAGMLSGLGIRYDMGPGDHPLLGKRMPPDQELTLPDGTRTRIADLLHTAQGLLITTTGQTAEITPDRTDRLQVLTATWAPGHDPGLDTVLIRPDGYIAWTSPGTDTPLTDALDRWFGTARTTVTTGPA